MKRFNTYALILILGVFFIGCSSGPTYERTYDSYSTGFHDLKRKSEIMINYSALAGEAVKKLFSKTTIPNKIIVTDFVDLTSLNNNTRLGYVLSNSIKDSLINMYKVSVIEAEISKYFKLSGNGLKILSRDIDKVKSTSFNVKKAVVGTYTYTDSELVVFVKLVNLKTGIIEGSYTKTLPMGPSTKMMLTTK